MYKLCIYYYYVLLLCIIIIYYYDVLCIIKVKLVTLIKGEPGVPFSIATTPRCGERRYPFPGLLHFTFDPCPIMLNLSKAASGTIFQVFGMT